ncbi:MAG: FkbM family methyltransferase [Candidatus Levyibacteriota bacterium]
MANLREISRSINAFEKTGRRASLPKEIAWVLRRTAQEDLSQMEEILDKNDYRRISPVLVYGQRLVEIGYIFAEVFLRGEYKNWEPKSKSPRIIDLGGDPGIFSVLFWKSKAPDAQITVVEANPATTSVMRENLDRRRIKNVQIINAAVAGDANESATLHLHTPRSGWHTQDYVDSTGTRVFPNEYTVSVPKIRLSDLIGEGEEVDLLKIDIEGSEGDVIRELADSGKLKQVNEIIMEFHHDPVRNPRNSLIEILNVLGANELSVLGAHVTIGKGIRKKINISISDLDRIDSIGKKIYLTLHALKK